MSELDEILDSKNAHELLDQLLYQIDHGESLGGQICGETIYRLEKEINRLIKNQQINK